MRIPNGGSALHAMDRVQLLDSGWSGDVGRMQHG